MVGLTVFGALAAGGLRRVICVRVPHGDMALRGDRGGLGRRGGEAVGFG